jgi:P-type E1-E2 ATPase
MIASGRTLEDYGIAQAKKSLTKLVERIPNEITLWEEGKMGGKLKIDNVKIGQEIVIRKGEVIALDGTLISETGLTDESSLTGEPYAVEKIAGDQIRSGTINLGDLIIIKVTKTQKDSTYNKIIEMVKSAQNEKSPLIRMADKYSGFFTIITLLITGSSYVLSGFDLSRALSVLAIATPCPLIIATPIALLGGVNKASKKHIIIKKLASLEILSRAQSLIFDKTGTITLGKPRVVEFKSTAKEYSEADILAISEAIERNSLHPLAKAIVNFAKAKNAKILHAQKIEEKIGSGITGVIDNKTFTLSKIASDSGMQIGVFAGKTQIAYFVFEDEIKEDSKNIIKNLKSLGFDLYIFTGDKKEAAEKVVKDLLIEAGLLVATSVADTVTLGALTPAVALRLVSMARLVKAGMMTKTKFLKTAARMIQFSKKQASAAKSIASNTANYEVLKGFKKGALGH